MSEIELVHFFNGKPTTEFTVLPPLSARSLGLWSLNMHSISPDHSTSSKQLILPAIIVASQQGT
jgi:hypothetical protein